MPGSSSWLPHTPQGVKGLDDDDGDGDDDDAAADDDDDDDDDDTGFIRGKLLLTY